MTRKAERKQSGKKQFAAHLKRLERRERAIIDLLEVVPQRLQREIPLSLNELLKRRERASGPSVLAALRHDVTDAEPPHALKFEWYYDGREPVAYAAGHGFTKVEEPYSIAGTDLVNVGHELGAESDAKLGGRSAEVSGSELGGLLEVDHAIRGEVEDCYLHELAEKLLPSMPPDERLKLPVVENCYSHLIHLRLYQLLGQACLATSKRSPWVFVGSHERWPVLVGAPL